MRKTRWINDVETFANWEYIPKRPRRSVFALVGEGLFLAVVAGVSAAVAVVSVAAAIKWVVS